MTNEQREAVKEWLADLRSGKFKQGTSLLCFEDKEGLKHCCLGVACETYARVTGQPLHRSVEDRRRWMDEEPVKAVVFEGYDAALPRTVAEWLGLATIYGDFELVSDEVGPWDTLTELNDDMRLTFAEIADFIEKAMEKPEIGLFTR